MPTKLTTNANEEGTYVITAAFTDTPNEGLTWTLTDMQGTVINEREDVALTPDTSVDIVLHGDDLALPDKKRPGRAVTIKGTYNSAYGMNLELKDQVSFDISDLAAVG